MTTPTFATKYKTPKEKNNNWKITKQQNKHPHFYYSKLNITKAKWKTFTFRLSHQHQPSSLLYHAWSFYTFLHLSQIT